jgi:hypothetical protein
MTVPFTKVSGPVPNENVAAVIVVAAVTPEKSSTNDAGPIVYGEQVLKAVVHVRVGSTVRYGRRDHLARRAATESLHQYRVAGDGESPRAARRRCPIPMNRTGEPLVKVTTPLPLTLPSCPEALKVSCVPGALLSVNEMSLSACPAARRALGANVFVNVTSMTPAPVVKSASAASGLPPPVPDAPKLITVACAARSMPVPRRRREPKGLWAWTWQLASAAQASVLCRVCLITSAFGNLPLVSLRYRLVEGADAARRPSYHGS